MYTQKISTQTYHRKNKNPPKITTIQQKQNKHHTINSPKNPKFKQKLYTRILPLKH
jgi:hypothetical protein